MKNGIPYPVDPEFKKIIEKKRREFMKKNGIRISQATFLAKFITPRIKPIILKENIKLNIITRNRGRKRKNV